MTACTCPSFPKAQSHPEGPQSQSLTQQCTSTSSTQEITAQEAPQGEGLVGVVRCIMSKHEPHVREA
jgi:hypothetical protein